MGAYVTPEQRRLGEAAEAARYLTTDLPSGHRWRPSRDDPTAIDVAVGGCLNDDVHYGVGAAFAASWSWVGPCRTLRDVRRARTGRL